MRNIKDPKVIMGLKLFDSTLERLAYICGERPLSTVIERWINNAFTIRCLDIHPTNTSILKYYPKNNSNEWVITDQNSVIDIGSVIEFLASVIKTKKRTRSEKGITKKNISISISNSLLYKIKALNLVKDKTVKEVTFNKIVETIIQYNVDMLDMTGRNISPYASNLIPCNPNPNTGKREIHCCNVDMRKEHFEPIKEASKDTSHFIGTYIVLFFPYNGYGKEIYFRLYGHPIPYSW